MQARGRARVRARARARAMARVRGWRGTRGLGLGQGAPLSPPWPRYSHIATCWRAPGVRLGFSRARVNVPGDRSGPRAEPQTQPYPCI